MFVNRETEIERLERVLDSDTAQLVVIYGRRCCGKSTLLKRVMDDNAVYFSADMREAPLQINALAQRIEKFIPGFANPIYPGWESTDKKSLLVGEAKWTGNKLILNLTAHPNAVKKIYAA